MLSHHQRFANSTFTMSARSKRLTSICCIVLLLLGVASATSQQPDNVQNVIPRNACIDNSHQNCVTTDQQEHMSTYSYVQPNNVDEAEEIVISRGTTSLRGLEYTEDRLSAKDQILAKSRDASYWHSPDQDTLKQVLFIHRHGDRTPINFPSKDELAHEPFWQFHGLGQLTNRGKARLHLLGQIVRMRYDKFLGGSVNKNHRKSRASGSLRCIESAQVFLSSFLALDRNDSPDAKSLVWDKTSDALSQVWQPASVNTLAAQYDGLLNEGSQCAALDAEYAALDESDESKKLLGEFKHEAEVLKREYDFDMDHFYKWFWASSLLEVERSYFGHKMNPAVLAVYDRMQQAGDRALVLYQSTMRLRRARVGMLMDDMIKNMEAMRTSTSTTNSSSSSAFNRKFVHYSAHDINLIFLLGILDNVATFPVRPDYASNLMIELHHQPEGEWFLKFYYMQRVPSKPVEMHIEACERGHREQGRLCTLDKFGELMQKYRVTSWSNWMRECGNSMSDVNPYSENS